MATQEDTNRLTMKIAAPNTRIQSAIVGLLGSNALFMRSAADACPNIMLSKNQSFLPSELRTARAIANTVSERYRGGLPSRQRDTDPLRPDATELADIAADPNHLLHGVTQFGLGHDEQTPERIDDLNAFHRTRGREISILQKRLPTARRLHQLQNQRCGTECTVGGPSPHPAWLSS